MFDRRRIKSLCFRSVGIATAVACGVSFGWYWFVIKEKKTTKNIKLSFIYIVETPLINNFNFNGGVDTTYTL